MATAWCLMSLVLAAFIVLNCHPMLPGRHKQFPKMTELSQCENWIPLSLYDEVIGHKVICKLGQLTRVFLPKQGFRRSRMSISKWTKNDQTGFLVAGHDPHINITVYVDVSINHGPQSQNNSEVIIRSKAETKPRDRSPLFKFGTRSIDCTDYCL